jgi:hypothetical protein
LNQNGTFLDLNVNVLGGTVSTASFDSNGSGDGAHVDANVLSVTLAGGGPCAAGGDVNVIQFGPGDFNSFNVTATLPALECTTCSRKRRPRHSRPFFPFFLFFFLVNQRIAEKL